MSYPTQGGGGGGCLFVTGGTAAAVLLGTAAALAAAGLWPQLGIAVRVLAFVAAVVLTALLVLTGRAIAEPLPARRRPQ
jgi:hypothetical protein